MDRRDFLKRTGVLALGAASTTTFFDLAPASAVTPRKLTRWDKTQALNRQLIANLSKQEKPLARWDWIVVHHTAVEHGTLANIDRYHRKRFDDPLGIQYHFLIGNGKRAPNGLIELGRWRHQAPAIHLFKPERAPRGVAISLMGNFEKRPVGMRQMAAVVELTRGLMDTLKVPVDRVTTHRRVDGRLTQCPGKHFPYGKFIKQLSQ